MAAVTPLERRPFDFCWLLFDPLSISHFLTPSVSLSLCLVHALPLSWPFYLLSTFSISSFISDSVSCRLIFLAVFYGYFGLAAIFAPTDKVSVGRAQQFMRLSNASQLDFYWQQTRMPHQSNGFGPRLGHPFCFSGNCIEHINHLNCIFMRQVWPSPRGPLPSAASESQSSFSLELSFIFPVQGPVRCPAVKPFQA